MAWPMWIGVFTYGGGVSIEYIFLFVFGLNLNGFDFFQSLVIWNSISVFQFFISDSFVIVMGRGRYLKNC